MKKAAILIFQFLVLVLRSQSFIEDKKGYSSIQVPVGNISINTEGALTFNYTYGYPSINNLIKGASKPDYYSSNALTDFDSNFVKSPAINRFMFGVSASGESATGIQAIFSNGDFVPGTRLQGLFGVKCNFYHRNIYKAARKYTKSVEAMKPFTVEMLDAKSSYETHLGSFIKIYKDTFETTMKALVKHPNGKLDTTLAKNVKTQLEILKNHKGNDLSARKALDSLKTLLNSSVFDSAEFMVNGSTIKASFEALYAFIIQKMDLMYQQEREIANLANENMDLKAAIAEDYVANQNKNKLLTFYVSAERRSREFTLLNSAASKPEDMYQNKTFDGYLIRFGSNFYWNQKNILGISIGTQSTDNYDSLPDFKRETTTIVYQDSLRKDVSNKTISGKKGNYYTYNQFPIMVDYLYLIRTEADVFGINPYYRYNYIRKSDLNLKSNQTIGLGFYYFKKEKSAFLFGIYTEYNSAKQADDKRNWNQRLTLGIVAKLNLAPLSIGNY